MYPDSVQESTLADSLRRTLNPFLCIVSVGEFSVRYNPVLPLCISVSDVCPQITDTKLFRYGGGVSLRLSTNLHDLCSLNQDTFTFSREAISSHESALAHWIFRQVGRTRQSDGAD